MYGKKSKTSPKRKRPVVARPKPNRPTKKPVSKRRYGY